MGKASSAKKVARAARAGSTARVGDRRPMGFPLAIGAVVALGLGLIVFARATRDAEAEPGLTHHWHSAYGVYDCESDSFEPAFQSTFDPEGIHSHQDGIIHIHPFTAAVTGKKANLGVFLRAMGAEVDADGISFADDRELDAGVDCGGEPAVIQVLRWDNAFTMDQNEPEVFTKDLDSVRFTRDGQAFVIARAPLGVDIPDLPADRMDTLAEHLGGAPENTGPNTIPDFGTPDGGLPTGADTGDGTTDGTDPGTTTDTGGATDGGGTTGTDG